MGELLTDDSIKHLRHLPHPPFTAVTANLGPISVSPPHTDGGNKADGIALIPSAVVVHSNTPIQEDEERYLLIQYSAGSLFRWVANGHQSDLQWQASATLKDIVQREEDRKTLEACFAKIHLLEGFEVKNFTGRARVVEFGMKASGGLQRPYGE
ncbi:hypothetical protein B0H14DRAFT_3507601 [Mycena olivaceomarginata]|nr:hypothetical protein B0H14DRAFT_3507601 [Mycena olivaceomarginata]